jgi:hypothetical protein
MLSRFSNSLKQDMHWIRLCGASWFLPRFVARRTTQSSSKSFTRVAALSDTPITDPFVSLPRPGIFDAISFNACIRSSRCGVSWVAVSLAGFAFVVAPPFSVELASSAFCSSR